MGIKEEITKIAVEQGYDGAKPKSIAQAIDALTDTLAGEDVKSGRSVVDAIRKYAPYVGGSGGGTKRVELFNETVTVEQNEDSYSAALAYTGDITDDPLHVVFDGVEYELPKSSMGNAVIYGTFTDGMPDFSTYPLALEKDFDDWYINTETAGTHTIVAYTDSATPTLKALQPIPTTVDSQPQVGETLYDSRLEVGEMHVGSQVVFGDLLHDDTITFSIPSAAAGVTVVVPVDAASTIEDISTYLLTLGDSDTIETVEDFDLDVSVDQDHDTISFVMPEWNAEEGQLPIMYIERGII